MAPTADKPVAYFDLGAYNGDTVDLAIRAYPGLRAVYAFEPLSTAFAQLASRHRGDNFHLYHVVAGVADGRCSIFRGQNYGDISSSTFEQNPNCRPGAYEEVDQIDFPRLFRELAAPHIEANVDIVLKLNIEGGEYAILERMIADNSIALVRKLYCDWHWSYVGVSEDQHHELVKRLRRIGFDVCGGKADEFYYSQRRTKRRCWLQRQKTYHGRSFKLWLKHWWPSAFWLAKRTRSATRSWLSKMRFS